jgi:hypothetical protein
MLLLILARTKTSNISYDRSVVNMRAMGRCLPIWIFDVRTVGLISCALICNGRRGRILFERPWRDLTKKRGAVYTALDCKP